jgi:hypothetical protein
VDTTPKDLAELLAYIQHLERTVEDLDVRLKSVEAWREMADLSVPPLPAPPGTIPTAEAAVGYEHFLELLMGGGFRWVQRRWALLFQGALGV